MCEACSQRVRTSCSAVFDGAWCGERVKADDGASCCCATRPWLLSCSCLLFGFGLGIQACGVACTGGGDGRRRGMENDENRE